MYEKNMSTPSRGELLKKVQEADFYALDLQLYLNTHPHCSRALSMYKNAVKKAKNARNEFESIYGPITAMAASDASPWQWIKSPWTWEKERRRLNMAEMQYQFPGVSEETKSLQLELDQTNAELIRITQELEEKKTDISISLIPKYMKAFILPK